MTEDALDDPQMIVAEIHALATGESQKFRTLVGQMGNDLMALRNAVPIEEYLGKDISNFAYESASWKAFPKPHEMSLGYCHRFCATRKTHFMNMVDALLSRAEILETIFGMPEGLIGWI